MNTNRLLDPVPVRFRRETKDRLIFVGRRFGLTPSEIIRRAVAIKLSEWEQAPVLVIEADLTGNLKEV